MLPSDWSAGACAASDWLNPSPSNNFIFITACRGQYQIALIGWLRYHPNRLQCDKELIPEASSRNQAVTDSAGIDYGYISIARADVTIGVLRRTACSVICEDKATLWKLPRICTGQKTADRSSASEASTTERVAQQSYLHRSSSLTSYSQCFLLSRPDIRGKTSHASSAVGTDKSILPQSPACMMDCCVVRFRWQLPRKNGQIVL